MFTITEIHNSPSFRAPEPSNAPGIQKASNAHQIVDSMCLIFVSATATPSLGNFNHHFVHVQVRVLPMRAQKLFLAGECLRATIELLSDAHARSD